MNREHRTSNSVLLILASLLLSTGLLTLSLAVMVEPARAQTGVISGTVTYYGSISGSHDVVVSIYTSTQQASLQVYVASGPVYTYSFGSLGDGTYYLFAYLDEDGSGGAPDEGEPFSWYSSNDDGTAHPVVVSGEATVAGIDITLTDPWQVFGSLRGRVNGLVVHPTLSGTLYAAVGLPGDGRATKVYTSTDGGANWTVVYTSASAQIEALATVDTIVYAAGVGVDGTDLIVKSSDGGRSWATVFTGTESSYTILRAADIDPITTTTAYAAGSIWGSSFAGIVYRTQDGGLSWTPVLTVPHEGSSNLADLHTVIVHPLTPTTVFVGGYRETGGSHYAVLYRSLDGGDTWSVILTDTQGTTQQFTAVAVHPLTPTRIYAGTQVPKYIYRSYDGGDTWEMRIHYNRGRHLGIDPPHTIYAPDDWREIDVSTQDGDPGTWFKAGGADNNSPDDFVSFDIDTAPTPSALYLGGDVAGVFRSDNGAVDWYPRSDGIVPAVVPTDIDVDPQDRSRLFVATGCGGGWMTVDGGLEWTEIVTASGCMGTFAINPEDPTIIYGGAFEGDQGAVMRSEDGGLSFYAAYTSPVIPTGGEERIYALSIAPSLSSTVYAVGQDDPAAADAYGIVVHSTDGGASWTEVLTLANGSVEAIAIDPLDHTAAYIGGEDCSAGPCMGFVYRTTDGGLQWERILTPTGKVRSIAVDYQKPSVIYVADDSDTVRKSIDGGETWVVLTPLSPGGSLVAIDPRVPSHIYVVGAGFMFESIDGGQSWSEYGAPINQGASLMMPGALAIDGGTITQTMYGSSNGVTHYTRPAPQPGGPAAVTAWPSDASIPIGRAVTITSLIADQYGNWVVDGTVVTFTASPEGTFSGSATITKTTTGGHVQAALSGLVIGTARITVTAGVGTDITSVHIQDYFVNEVVVPNLPQPTAIDWAPDGRMFITLKPGVVRVFQDGQLLPTPFIDLSAEVNTYWDRGLLGIAVHPSFPITPYVYLLYSYDPPELLGNPLEVDGPDGSGERVSRLVRVSAYLTDTNVADPTSKVVILGTNSTYANIGDPADPAGAGGAYSCDDGGTPIPDCLPIDSSTHSAGSVVFGSDGTLFVSNGDGAGYLFVDPRALRALDVNSLAGKVMRVDPDTGQGLPDNPFYDGDPSSNRSRVWSLGMRNPFRFALHPGTDEPFIGDVGWDMWEEINTGKGKNFGWPCFEGDDAGSARQPTYEVYSGTQASCAALYAQGQGAVEPSLYAYAHAGTGAAILAGDFYTGTTYPITYHNALFIADYNRDWIKYLTFDGNGDATAHDFLEDVSSQGGPVHLALGPDSNLYYVTLNPGGSGEVRRILYTDDPVAVASATPTNGYPPLIVQFSSEGSSDPNEEPEDLSYAWWFGDGATSSSRNPTHTYTISGTYTAILTVTNSLGGRGTDHVIVTVGNLAPTATITAPPPGMLYNAGDTIDFSGIGEDYEDGVITGTGLVWEVLLHHNEHTHPNVFNATGTQGSFVDSDHGDNNWTELCLTVTDSGGLQDTECVELHPRTVTYTFDTVPSGLQIYYAGVAHATPFTVETTVNAERLVAAPPWQGEFKFISWSDNGAASHMITVSSTQQALVAMYYQHHVWLPAVTRSY